MTYLEIARRLLKKFKGYKITQIPREENERADALSKLASATNCVGSKTVPIAHLAMPSTVKSEEFVVAEIRPQSDNWTTQLKRYFEENILPEDTSEAKRIKYRSTWYTIMNGELYRKGFSKALQRCVTGEEGK